MPVEFKDYYKVLGVPRDASEADIKKAFRKLARQHHPDVAKDKKSAEARFKEINEAHEVLSDPEKRKRYDELGANWDNPAFQQGGPGFGRRGPDGRRATGDGREDYEFHFGGTTGFSDFFEQFFSRGGRSRGGGSFEDIFGEPEAGGFGRAAARGQDIEGDILVTLDEIMHGAERLISLQRENPRTGEANTETIKVRIPVGVQDGQRIRVQGKGGAGRNGGPAGDLFLRVRAATHPDFRVRGADLLHDLAVAPWEAVLGASIAVPTLKDRVNLRIPPGTNNGQQLRLRGQGLPKGRTGERGDLYVVVDVQLPERLSPEEQALWEKLRDVSSFHPRAAAGAG